MTSRKYQVITYGHRHKRVIFLLGGWGVSQAMLWPISKVLEFAGFRCITYSFGYQLLVPNIELTINNVLEVKQTIIDAVKHLYDQGYRDFSIFGTSLGSLISLLVVSDSHHIKKVIFNTPGVDLAESLWKWDYVFPEFKQKLIKRYRSLSNLKQAVKSINPPYHLSKLRDKKLLIYISANDEMVSCSEKTIISLLQEQRAQFKLIVNRTFGHVMTSAINLINAPEYLKFLNVKL